LKTVEKLKITVDSMNSQGSNSLSDINDSFERRARKKVQNKLHSIFKTYKLRLNQSEKKLDSQILFSTISQFIPGNESTVDGEIDVYFGILSPKEWKAIDQQSDIFVVNGSFADSAKSLNAQKSCEIVRSSPTTSGLPKEFNYYCVFEITTGADISYKLNQLETQLQYIIARDFYRSKVTFPSSTVTRKTNIKNRKIAYRDFVASEIIKVIAFSGVILSKEYSDDIEKRIINLINSSNGYDRPCLWKLLAERRFIYMNLQ
jgi:hypothetical protein